MSVNIPTHYAQQYSTNINLLLQVQGGKLSDCVMHGSHVGKQVSPVDQFGKVEMQEVTGRFGEMPRVDAPTDRRWLAPRDFDLPQLLDSFDKLRLITEPKSAYVQNAVNAARRKQDAVIIEAFQAAALTGEAGGTSTSFTAGNEVDVATGGSNSKLNVPKLRAVKLLMEQNFIDFEAEQAYAGLTAVDHDALLGEIQVVSMDYQSRPVMEGGLVKSFMGFQFKQTELIETIAAGTNEVTLPVWVKSGMHLGTWNEMEHSVDQRADLRGRPWQLYTILTCNATRLEEAKVFAIESYRA
jgi:hypothetical protein